MNNESLQIKVNNRELKEEDNFICLGSVLKDLQFYVMREESK